MADNTIINPGTAGDNIATDDIGGVKYQRVKLIHGADGVNDGDVSTANGFPIQVLSIVPGTAATNLGKAEDAAHASTDVGVMSLGVRTDAPANRSGTDGDYEPVQLTKGRLWTNVPIADAAALTNVADAASNTTILSSNTARRGASFFNDSDQILYLKLGATASSTSFTVRMAPYDYYELQQPVYTGIIDGIWAANSTGSVRVTEYT